MNSKIKLGIHLLAQILAQAAVYALLKDHSPEAIYAAVVAILGVTAAYYDNTSAPVA